MKLQLLTHLRRVVPLFFLFLTLPAFGANLLVSNTNDSGAGSLRQAILDNNATGTNTIIFSNIVTGTITLTSGELFISKNVTILGPGPSVLAVNGNAAGRVFDVNLAGTVTIAGLSVTNGSFAGGAGGAIYNYQSTLTVSNCIVSGSTARRGGGIYNDHGSASATLTVKNSVVSDNVADYGGGIYNNALNFGSAILSVTSSRIIGNSAKYGGGIYNDARSSGTAPVAISTSTFSSNSVVNDFNIGGGVGGGIYNDCENSGNATISVNNSTFDANSAQDGGAINNNGFQGTAKIFASDCTFSGNVAGSGGAISSSGLQGIAQVIVNASTFSSNRGTNGFGTIYNANGTLQIGDSILSSAQSETNVVNYSATAMSSGYNLFSDNASGVLTNANDKLNTNPLLGPLQDNGGPTFTHALLSGSPAIDQGKRDAISFLPVTTDQRGVARPLDFPAITNAAGGDGSDVGAVEFNQPTLAIQKNQNNVVLSWESFLGAFTLETSTSLGTTNGWTAAAGSAALVGDEYQQTNGPVSGNRFFRLRSP